MSLFRQGRRHQREMRLDDSVNYRNVSSRPEKSAYQDEIKIQYRHFVYSDVSHFIRGIWRVDQEEDVASIEGWLHRAS